MPSPASRRAVIRSPRSSRPDSPRPSRHRRALIALTIEAGQVFSGEDFGDQPTASISGDVFDDLDGDGTLQGGDPGLSGWTVNLLNGSNQVIATTSTHPSGSYSFTICSRAPTGSRSSCSPATSPRPRRAWHHRRQWPGGHGELRRVRAGLDQRRCLQRPQRRRPLAAGSAFALISGGANPAISSDGPGRHLLVHRRRPRHFTARGGPADRLRRVLPAPHRDDHQRHEHLRAGPRRVPDGHDQRRGLQRPERQRRPEFERSRASPAGPSTCSHLKTVVQATTNSSGDYSFTGVGPGTYTIADVLQTGLRPDGAGLGKLLGHDRQRGQHFGRELRHDPGRPLAVTGLSVTPSSLQSGTSLVVSWDDTNGGNTPIAASFTDHVDITNLTTGQVLGVADVAYDVYTRGRRAAGPPQPSNTRSRSPTATRASATSSSRVTADDYDAVSGGLNAASRTDARSRRLRRLAPYADLVPAPSSPRRPPHAGQTVTVSWTDTNNGNAATPTPWVDEILLSYDGTIADAVPVGTLAVTGPIAAGSSATEQAQVTIPVTGPASAGSLQFVDRVQRQRSFFELNTANNSAIDAQRDQRPAGIDPDRRPSARSPRTPPNPTILGDRLAQRTDRPAADGQPRQLEHRAIHRSGECDHPRRPDHSLGADHRPRRRRCRFRPDRHDHGLGDRYAGRHGGDHRHQHRPGGACGQLPDLARDRRQGELRHGDGHAAPAPTRRPRPSA